MIRFDNTVCTIAQREALNTVPSVLKRLNVSNPLAVISKSVWQESERDLADGALSSIPVLPIASLQVSDETAKYIAERCVDRNHDAIIAIGGGTIIDLAKTAYLLAEHTGKGISDFEGQYQLRKRSKRALIAIPTTIGSASEATATAYIREAESGRLVKLCCPALYPDVAVIDPNMLKSLPSTLLAAHVITVFARAIEALTSSLAQPLSDQFALRAITLLSVFALRLVQTPFDLEERSHVALASHVAGIAASQAGCSLAHALANTVAHSLSLPYSNCMAILFPHALVYNFPKTEEPLKRLYRFLSMQEEVLKPSSDAPAAKQCIAWIVKFVNDISGASLPVLPRRFFDIETDLQAHALAAVAPLAQQNPDTRGSRMPIELHQVITVLEAAYWGYSLDRTVIPAGIFYETRRKIAWTEPLR